MSVPALTGRTILVGGAVAVGGVATAASAARRRARHEDPAPQQVRVFESRAAVPESHIAMSPEQLDAALAAAFPGDETPGYL